MLFVYWDKVQKEKYRRVLLTSVDPSGSGMIKTCTREKERKDKENLLVHNLQGSSYEK